MKTRTPITLALAAAAALGLGASASAQQGYDPNGYGQPPDPGYQQPGYQQPGYSEPGPAPEQAPDNQPPYADQAPYPPPAPPAPYDPGYAGPRSYRQLLIAAGEMDDAATYASRQFDRNNRRPDPNEAAVAARLADLAESAHRFHREVATDRVVGSRRSRADFQRLVRSYERAADASRNVSERPYVDQSMDRIGRRLDQTASLFGMNLAEMSRFRGERQGYGRYRDDRGYDRRGYENGYRPDGGGYGQAPPPSGGYDQAPPPDGGDDQASPDGGVYVPGPPPPPPSR